MNINDSHLFIKMKLSLRHNIMLLERGKKLIEMHFLKLHYTIICGCDEENDGCQLTDLCHIALGFM